MKKNQRIRLLAKGSGVALWEIARELGISEPTLTRRLRYQLSKEREEEMIAVIQKLKKDEA